MRCNLVAASQYSFIVNTTDHGTWRRIRHYSAKAKFRKNPDPASPFEKRDDQRFVREYPTHPLFQSAVLSVLSHYYERLQNEFGGELKNVRAPTIERETEAFRVSQDALHRWICEAIVVSPDGGAEYSLGVLGGFFIEWYAAHVDRGRHVAGEIIKEIESSAIGKFLKPAPNRTLVLRGCRVLVPPEVRIRPGEEFLSEAEMRGRRSVGEWAEACAEAGRLAGLPRADGRPWWAARDPSGAAPPAWVDRAPPAGAARRRDPAAPAPAPDNVAALDDLFDVLADDVAALRAERAARTCPAGGGPAGELADADVDALLAGEWAPPAAPRGRAAFSLDDVYA